MGKTKNKPIKIRKTWNINPKERIKEDKIKKDTCEKCKIYLTNPELCKDCEKYTEKIDNA
jgi:hypothetical protein